MHFSSARITKRIRWKRPPPSRLGSRTSRPLQPGTCACSWPTVSRATASRSAPSCAASSLRSRFSKRRTAPSPSACCASATSTSDSSTGACPASTAARCRTGRAPATTGACSSWSRTAWCRNGPRSRPSSNAYEVMLKPFNESHVENLLKVFWRLNRSADVLLVDRSRTAREIIRDMLERTRFNFRVDETDTGANALRAIKASAFDIVLVDAGVDGGMGAEAACRVARDAPGSKVVLIGGADMRTSRSALTQFDLSGFILKPFDGAVLESALHDVLKLWRPYRLNAQIRAAAPAAAGASIAA